MSETKDNTAKEVFIEGIPGSAGTVIGLAYIHAPENIVSSTKQIKQHEISAHLATFRKGLKNITERWKKLQAKQDDTTSKNILAAQIEILQDPELAGRIKELIQENSMGAQQAISETFDEYIDFFSKSASPVMANRQIDLADIRDRLVEEAGDRTVSKSKKRGDIAVAKEFSPREIIELSNQGLKGVVMEQGGRTSHAAIIARSIGIPAIIGASHATKIIKDQSKLCLNGGLGYIYVNPTQTTCAKAQKIDSAHPSDTREQAKLCARPLATADDHSFTLRANIEFSEELNYIKQCRAQGIGLLRTEALYLNRGQFGDRKSQQDFYEQILDQTHNHPVTIRLFDVGGDKFLNNSIAENNPFLGWRGIRMLLDERDLLREQLTAILAAAGHHPGKVKILVPMVTTTTEIEQVKKEIKRSRQKLMELGEPVDQDIPLGIMVEIPNVALQASIFAQKIDFFSIGTNDLIQYLLAVDRGNARISALYNQRHPVMWQMIQQVVEAAHRQNITAEVCGELASYPVAAACLTGMNIDGLSMNPSDILNVKELLIKRKYSEMKQLADRVLRCDSLDEVENLFKNWKNR